jgi:hypothetical protein
MKLTLTLAIALAGIVTLPVQAGTLPNGADDLVYRGQAAPLCFMSAPPLCYVNGFLTVVPFNPVIVPLGNDERDIFTASFSFDVLPGGPIAAGPYNLTGTIDILTPGFLGGPGPYFNTEILAMDFSGPGIMVRESPTQQSLGESPISSVTLPAGTYTIPSFFDVFVEISLDSGSSWIPSSPAGPYNVATPEPGTWLLAGTALVGLIWKRRR